MLNTLLVSIYLFPLLAKRSRSGTESGNEIDFGKVFQESSILNDDAKITVYERAENIEAFAEPDGTLKLAKIENLVVLIPGKANDSLRQDEYTKDFCQTLKKAYFKYDNYSLLCYDWRPHGNDVNNITEMAQQKGLSLAKFLKKKYKGMVKKFHLVCHDLGCVVAQSAGKNAYRPIDFIFGLDQRNLTHPNSSSLYLSKDAANIVETIYTGHSGLPEVQRTFFFMLKWSGWSERNKFVIYKEFASFITEDGVKHLGYYCSSVNDFNHSKCDLKKQASLWSNDFIKNPMKSSNMGRFFIDY